MSDDREDHDDAQDEENAPDIDAICGQAAWMLAQVMAIRLIENGTVDKSVMQEDIVAAIAACRHDPGMNRAQREAGHMLAQFHTNLEGPDKAELN